jgi:hypothetical protein
VHWRLLSALLCLAAVVVQSANARAQEGCGRVVVLTLPGVTWSAVAAIRPPALLDVARDGAIGSLSVRTNSPRTSYASGFASLGGGARLDGGRTTGGPAFDASSGDDARFETGVRVAGLDELVDAAAAAGYGAVPGALGTALRRTPVMAIGNADAGLPAPLPAGAERWTLLAAMDSDGVVDRAATGPNLLVRDDRAPYGVRSDPEELHRAVDQALRSRCSVLIVDQGDVTRADAASVVDLRGAREARAAALRAADDLLARLRAALDPARDLLLVVSPTSPAWEDEAHLGIALAEGSDWPRGSVLSSATTRRPGLVTLGDVGPTILEHLGVSRPPTMTGQPWFPADAPETRIAAAVDLDAESVLVDALKPPVSTGFVAFQVLVYLGAVAVIGRASRGERRALLRRALEVAALAVVAFPGATYLAGVLPAHALAASAYAALLVIFTGVLVAVTLVVARAPLARLLALTGGTTLLLVADLVTGGRLQLNTVFGYSPIIAGRFAGAGNITFAVLAVSALVAGTLLVELSGDARRALAGVAVGFLAVIVVDGAPQFGSDLGGVLALVPALGGTWVLLSGRRPTLRVWLTGALVALVAVGLFIAIDLARPSEARTHLARLWLDVTDQGGQVLVDTIARKAEANLRVFTSTVYTLFVPPALAALAWLLLRPQGRWQVLASAHPRLRAGLIGGLVLAVLGFAVNDSGIVIPAVVLSYLVPLALLVHLSLDGSHDP